MLDLTKTYKLEPKLAQGDTMGLAYEGCSKLPGTMTGYCVEYNPLTGKYKTGLDEFAPEVLSLSKKEREEKVEWIKNTRAALEEKIGSEGILNCKNDDFWEVWQVFVDTGVDKKIRLMGQHPQFQPELYWQHELALITMEANDTIPKTKKEAGNPKYKQAQFFLTTRDEETSLVKDKVQKNRQRNVEMNKLFGEGGAGFDRAFAVAYLLGIQRDGDIGIEKLEEVLEIFTPQPEYLDSFLALCKKDNEELAVEMVIKKAIYYDIIKFNPADKIYYRGGANFRPTEEATISYFKVSMGEATMAREFAEIKGKVAQKDNTSKKLK